MYKLNDICRRLSEIEKISQSNWIRIFCTDGEVFDGLAECTTYVTIEDDEDVLGLSFMLRSGKRYDVAGVQIERFEVLEPRFK